jgi:pimeloyl-ACP methyl ester carboxylesterase
MPHVVANGVHLWVEEEGSGPPLLLIMGLGASLDSWFGQRHAFGIRHRVIMFDHRGVGRSACPPPPWTIADMAADAIGVLDALGIASAPVLGVSMGGMIAQEMAIGWPERVERLVVAMSFARPEALRRTLLLHRRWARLQGADSFDESVANLAWLVSPQSLNDPARMAAVLEVLRGLPPLPAESYAHQIDAIIEHDTLGRLGSVRAPTLVLAAPDDVLTPVFLNQEIAAAIPGAELRILASGSHAVLLEDPEQFYRAVLDWLG